MAELFHPPGYVPDDPTKDTRCPAWVAKGHPLVNRSEGVWSKSDGVAPIERHIRNYCVVCDGSASVASYRAVSAAVCVDPDTGATMSSRIYIGNHDLSILSEVEALAMGVELIDSTLRPYSVLNLYTDCTPAIKKFLDFLMKYPDSDLRRSWNTWGHIRIIKTTRDGVKEAHSLASTTLKAISGKYRSCLR